MLLARDAVTVEKFRGKVVGYLSLERNVSIASAAVFIIALGEELWKKFLPKYLEALGATAILPLPIATLGCRPALLACALPVRHARAAPSRRGASARVKNPRRHSF